MNAVPVSQRPGMAGASLTTRLDAVFGALEGAAAPSASTTSGPVGAGWSLRQDVQPFQAGKGLDDYSYSSDEEDPNEGLLPVMPTRLVDSDEDEGAAHGAGMAAEHDEEAEAARERLALQATCRSRRAFEAEAEEDVFDRMATGTMDLRNMAANARPPGSTQVPTGSSLERLYRSRIAHAAGQVEGEDEAADSSSDEGDAPGGGPPACPGANQAQVQPPASGVQPPQPVASTEAPDQQQQQEAEMAEALPAQEHEQQLLPSRKRGRGRSTAAVAAAAEAAVGTPLPTGHAVQQQQQPTDAEMAPADNNKAAASGARPGSCLRVADGQQTPTARQRGGKRVQWSDYAGRQLVSASAAGGHGAGQDDPCGPGPSSSRADGGSPGGRQQRAAPHAGAAGGRGSGRVKLEWQRHGFVPDHVRNPHRYTMYALDEALTVGGRDKGGHGGSGGGGAGAGPEGEEAALQRQALAGAQLAAAEHARAEHDPDRAELEAVQAQGVQFRPRARRQDAGGAPASGPAGAGAGAGATGVRAREPQRPQLGLTSLEQDDGDGGHGGGMDVDGPGAGAASEGPAAAAAVAGASREGGAVGGLGGRRHFRSRAVDAMEEDS